MRLVLAARACGSCLRLGGSRAHRLDRNRNCTNMLNFTGLKVLKYLLDSSFLFHCTFEYFRSLC